jgi:hypothetical protein
MSIHVSGGGGTLRRIVISCDVPGCPIQVEPPAAERWRNDSDARSWARAHAAGWVYDPVRGTDYCPDHAEFGATPVAEKKPPRPTATIRDAASNPLNRDDYAVGLRARLTEGVQPSEHRTTLTVGQAEVIARLLDELAGVYRGEDLGSLAHELAMRLDSQLREQD